MSQQFSVPREVSADTLQGGDTTTINRVIVYSSGVPSRRMTEILFPYPSIGDRIVPVGSEGNDMPKDNDIYDIKRPDPPLPTQFLPGTPAKVELMRERHERGYGIFHPDDVKNVIDPDDTKYAMSATSQYNRRTHNGLLLRFAVVLLT